MQRPKRPWWAGKAPEWAAGGEDNGDAGAAAPAAALSQKPQAHAPPPGSAADPRLLRLTQRQGMLARHTTSEAMVVQRRRQRSPVEREGAASPLHPSETELAYKSGAVEGRGRAGGPGAAHEEEEEDQDDQDQDAEAIAARRMAIRARQLAAAADTTAAGSDQEDTEDSSEYTTDDDSDDDHRPVMLKPAFVPKTDRETLPERDAVIAQAEQTTRQQEEQLLDRKRQTQELVMQAQLLESEQEAPAGEASDLDTDDDKDELAQYEAWRERELQRIARDRQLRLAGTKAEATAEATVSVLPAAAMAQPKKKWNFLQKYWHKGAFFQTEGDEAEAVLGNIMRRDYDAPTGEDKFDKQMLPKIMQVRNFGRRGRTKWTHLAAEDTTFSQGGVDPMLPGPDRQPSRHLQDFSKPRSLRT